MVGPAKDAPRYTAFLSYSHKDAIVAGRLHRRLETYRLPRRLVGTETARGPVPARLWPIFRDREELPAATDLTETVRGALAESGALIVLCSPAAATSLWVAEEIETFRRFHPDRPILAAILDGDPPDCFPAALRAFGQDGTWHEPLATDLRPQGDGTQLGLLKLVAGITGLGLDALVQRDANRRIRRVTAVTAAALAAMLVMAALTLVALDARDEAERQRAEAEGLVEFMLTDLRQRLRGVGRLDVMTAVNRRALGYYGSQQELGDLPAHSLLRRARVLHALGEDEMARDNDRTALSLFREAYRATDAALERAPNEADGIFAHAQSEYWLGYFAFEHGEFAPARRHFEGYNRLAARLLAIDSGNLTWLREAAYAESNLCSLAIRESQREAALRVCSRALQWMERVRMLSGDEPSAVLDVANRHAWLADAWNIDGRWDRVLLHRRRQEELARSLIARDPTNIDFQDFWMRTQFTFGRLLLERGYRSEAQSHLADALAAVKRLRRTDPANVTWRSFEVRVSDAINNR